MRKIKFLVVCLVIVVIFVVVFFLNKDSADEKTKSNAIEKFENIVENTTEATITKDSLVKNEKQNNYNISNVNETTSFIINSDNEINLAKNTPTIKITEDKSIDNNTPEDWDIDDIYGTTKSSDESSSSGDDYDSWGSDDAYVDNENVVYDPVENSNRKVWDFNVNLQKKILDPLTDGYDTVVESNGRLLIYNVLGNFDEPMAMLYNTMILRPDRTVDSIWRFLINSTIGLFGIFDVASELGIKERRIYFSGVLGNWGMGSGAYLIPPFYRPTNLRDIVGFVFDIFLNPINIGFPVYVSAVTTTAGIFNTYSNVRISFNEIQNSSLDSYVLVKEFMNVYFNRFSSLRPLDEDFSDIVSPEAIPFNVKYVDDIR